MQLGQGEVSKSVTAENRLNPLYVLGILKIIVQNSHLLMLVTQMRSLPHSTLMIVLILVLVMEKHFIHYDSVSGNEILFRNLNRRCSIILGFKIANSVLGHLNGVLHLKIHFQIFVRLLRVNEIS